MQGLLIVFEGVEGCGKTTQMQRCSDWLQTSDLWSCLSETLVMQSNNDASVSVSVRVGDKGSVQAKPLAPQDALASQGALGRSPGALDSLWRIRVEEQMLRDRGKKMPVVVTREPGGTPLGLGLRQLLLEKHPFAVQNRAELLMYAADRSQHVEEFLKPQLASGAIILCDRYTDSTVAYQGYGRGLDLKLIQQLNQIATDGLESDLTLWLDIDAETGLKRARQRGTADRIEQADIEFHRRVQEGFVRLAASNPQRIVRIDASKSEEEVHLAIQEILLQRLSTWFQKLS